MQDPACDAKLVVPSSVAGSRGAENSRSGIAEITGYQGAVENYFSARLPVGTAVVADFVGLGFDFHVGAAFLLGSFVRRLLRAFGYRCSRIGPQARACLNLLVVDIELIKNAVVTAPHGRSLFRIRVLDSGSSPGLCAVLRAIRHVFGAQLSAISLVSSVTLARRSLVDICELLQRLVQVIRADLR